MSNLEWILIRATGMSATVLLTAATVLGLMMSLRMRPRRWTGAVSNDIHRYVTGLALGMTGLHVLLLVLDSKAGVSLIDLVVPFSAESQAISVGFGTIAVLLLALLWWTSVNRSLIGAATWRKLHYLSFVAYAMAMMHGIFAGTDSSEIWAWPVYAVSIGAVGWLAWKRIAMSRAQAAAAAPLSPPAAHAPKRTASRPARAAARPRRDAPPAPLPAALPPAGSPTPQALRRARPAGPPRTAAVPARPGELPALQPRASAPRRGPVRL